MIGMSEEEQERLFNVALRVIEHERPGEDTLRAAVAAAAAGFLLSYSPESAVAQWEPLFYDLMLRHGRRLAEALERPGGPS